MSVTGIRRGRSAAGRSDHARPSAGSVVAAATYLPWLLLSLRRRARRPARPRRPDVASQAMQAVIVTVIAVLAALGDIGIPVLAILAFGLGVGEVVSAMRRRRSCRTSSRNPAAQGERQSAAITMIGQQFADRRSVACFSRSPWRCRSGWTPARSRYLPHCWRRCQAVPASGSAPTDAHRDRGGPALADQAPVVAHPRDPARRQHFLLRSGQRTLVLLATRRCTERARLRVLLAGAAIAACSAAWSMRASSRGSVHFPRSSRTRRERRHLHRDWTESDRDRARRAAGRDGFVTTLWNIVTVSLRQHIVPSELLAGSTASTGCSAGIDTARRADGGVVAHMFGLRAPYPIAVRCAGSPYCWAARTDLCHARLG